MRISGTGKKKISMRGMDHVMRWIDAEETTEQDHHHPKETAPTPRLPQEEEAEEEG